MRMVLALILASAAPAALAAPAERSERIPGLAAPATITVDNWGIAHIRAASARDAWFVQGWNAARDRLWQIDLWRKRGLGRLAASFGADYVAQDRAARLFLYRGDMKAEWAAYAPGTQEMITAFTAGINAYVDGVAAGRLPLPVEFGLTQSRPEHWAPEDVVRIRSHALVGNVTSEVARARVACAGGIDADRLRQPLSPPHDPKPALDPCSIPADVLGDYALATRQVAFTPATGKLAAVDAAGLAAAAAEEGSNNWVVAATRTASGRPLLANDPHRQLGVPSLRYIVHVSAPGLDIIGAGEPALPGVSFGHNADAAWGLTIFDIDQEDLYAYALDPARPDQYRYGSSREAMRVVHETIEVKGEAPRDVTLRFTRHGPLLWADATRGFALRSVWAAPGAAGYLQASWLTGARSWADFDAAHGHWGAPPLNLVFATAAGTIGWAASGLAPVRPNWDGLTPVPGDGRYEWQGFQPEALPVSRDPAKGWFATANEMNLPPGFPNEARKIGFEWADRSRINRIEAVLGGNAKFALADAMALQTDSHSALAGRLASLAAKLTPSDPRAAAAIKLLGGWDHNEGADSAAAAIAEVWLGKHLGPAFLAATTPPDVAAAIGSAAPDAVLARLENPALPAATRAEVLTASLGLTLAELATRLGPDMAAWRWGDLHHATFVPAIAPRADAALRQAMTLGPLPLPGSGSTPKAASWDKASFNTNSGASVRMVVDVGAWDNSMIINSPGQSADPASRHYGDLFPLWAAGRYVPMLFSRAAVDAAAETVITLTP